MRTKVDIPVDFAALAMDSVRSWSISYCFFASLLVCARVVPRAEKKMVGGGVGGVVLVVNREGHFVVSLSIILVRRVLGCEENSGLRSRRVRVVMVLMLEDWRRCWRM